MRRVWRRDERGATGARVQICLLASWTFIACGFDTSREAPRMQSPMEPGVCGTTESVFPKLLAFVRAGRFERLRDVLERRLVPTADNPAPDPSLRTAVHAIVSLVEQLGFGDSAYLAKVASSTVVASDLGPLVATVFEFADGRLDRCSSHPDSIAYGACRHYRAAEATAALIRQCNPDPLLLALERMLVLESPSHGNAPWIVAVFGALGDLMREPDLQPFLESFERESERGRSAILAFIAQIASVIADDAFTIGGVEALLESAVYPVVDGALEDQIRGMVVLLDEVARPEAGVLVPFRGALRCMIQHPDERDDISGFVYDFIANDDIDIASLLGSLDRATTGVFAASELALLADAIRIVRIDLEIRDDLRELAAMFLSRPEVELVVPVWIDLLNEGVLAELIGGIVTLLDGCGRA